jgi:zinc transport system substrate-binding protein
MKKILFLFLLPLLLLGCNEKQDPIPESAKKNRVLVTHSPYNYFVSRLTQGKVEVVALVPPGASAHTFEPTPKQVIQSANSDIWFRTGETFEIQALTPLKSHAPAMLVVDLRTGIDMEGLPAHRCGDHEHADLHFWLSPLAMKQIIKTMANSLIEVYPEIKEAIQDSEIALTNELDQLVITMKTILDLAPNRTIMVSHPAYGYLCRDFKLDQLSIESEGRDPTPQKLTKIIQAAREKKINRIFIQPQHSKKGAEVIAKELGAEVIELDPYDDHYFENMRKIAWAFGGY